MATFDTALLAQKKAEGEIAAALLADLVELQRYQTNKEKANEAGETLGSLVVKMNLNIEGEGLIIEQHLSKSFILAEGESPAEQIVYTFKSKEIFFQLETLAATAGEEMLTQKYIEITGGAA